MRIRVCDSCKRLIDKHEQFIMCQRVQRNPSNTALIEYVRLGDLCNDCWNKLMGGKNG